MARARTGVGGKPSEKFDITREIASVVRAYGKSVGLAGDLDATADRYWQSNRV